MIDISVIIVSWNARDFLLKCLRSLFQEQTAYTSEIIVVDNASSDGSAEAVKENFPEVVLIQNETNFGFAKANNIGIRKSTGRYLYLINSDVEVLESCIDRLYDFMEANGGIGMAGPRILYPDGRLQVTCREFPSLWNNFCSAAGLNKVFPSYSFFSSDQMFYFNHDEIRSINVLAGCFLVVRRTAMKNVGLLDERFFIYSEDIDWCRRFWDADWQIAFLPEAEAIHYGGGSSLNAPVRFSLEQERATMQYWHKHHSMLSIMILLIILFTKHLTRLLWTVLLYTIKPTKRSKALKRVKQNISGIKFIFTYRPHSNSREFTSSKSK